MFESSAESPCLQGLVEGMRGSGVTYDGLREGLHKQNVTEVNLALKQPLVRFNDVTKGRKGSVSDKSRYNESAVLGHLVSINRTPLVKG